jgi:uncharacterized protein YdhG (YjbR/CyaY superfamily)
MKNAKPKDINEYISGFPKDIQKILKEVRATIKKAAPKAEEMISYAIPTYKLNNRPLIYFAGHTKHLGIYPAPVSSEEFKKEFSKYKTSRGTVQFPYDEPIPMKLITKIVKFKIKENISRIK